MSWQSGEITAGSGKDNVHHQMLLWLQAATGQHMVRFHKTIHGELVSHSMVMNVQMKNHVQASICVTGIDQILQSRKGRWIPCTAACAKCGKPVVSKEREVVAYHRCMQQVRKTTGKEGS